MDRQYDAMMKPKRFNIGDLVLKIVSLAAKNPAMENWGLIGKDPIGLSIAKSKDYTTWKP